MSGVAPFPLHPSEPHPSRVPYGMGYEYARPPTRRKLGARDLSDVTGTPYQEKF